MMRVICGLNAGYMRVICGLSNTQQISSKEAAEKQGRSRGVRLNIENSRKHINLLYTRARKSSQAQIRNLYKKTFMKVK